MTFRTINCSGSGVEIALTNTKGETSPKHMTFYVIISRAFTDVYSFSLNSKYRPHLIATAKPALTYRISSCLLGKLIVRTLRQSSSPSWNDQNLLVVRTCDYETSLPHYHDNHDVDV